MLTKKLATLMVFFIISGQASNKLLAQDTAHVVSDGDTLWGLAGKYYNNPWQWKRIYEANKDKISNPHWIYPGQEFSIPGVSAKVVAPAKAETPETIPVEGTKTDREAVAGTETAVVPETAADTKRPVVEETRTPGETAALQVEAEKEGQVVGAEVALKKEAYKRFTGASFIVPMAHSFAGRIIGSKDRRIMLVHGDVVYINIGSEDGLTAGSLCYIFRKGERMRGGRKVIKVGMLRVTEEINENSATAIITKSHEAISVRDYVEPAE